jgi:hypothetical protein
MQYMTDAPAGRRPEMVGVSAKDAEKEGRKSPYPNRASP